MANVDGMAELLKKLEAMGDVRQTQRVLRSAAGVGMRRVAREARARVPKGTVEHKTYKGRLVAPGFASRNVRVVTRINRNSGNAEALLGVRREAFYAVQFIELGTARIPATPWLVPSLEAKQDEAVEYMRRQMAKRIERIARGGK